MNMNRTFTRLLALMMAVVLALGCIGVTAFAATGTKDVTIYFYYHQDDYVKTTVQVSADATHVDMKTMNQAAKEAGIASGMGTWYIHGSYNNKILAGENANTPGVVWADVQCLYPIVDDRPVEPNLPINRMIKVNFLFEDTKQPVPGAYTMSVNQKTVLVDVQEVADLALENDLVLISLYRQIVDDEITAYVRQRLVSNPNATKTVNIYYYQQPYQQGDLPAASETVVVPVNTDMIDPSIMESKAPAGWALEVFNSRIQNDANGDPSVSVYGYANGWPVERNTYQLCLQVPAIPEKTDAVESRFTVMDGQSVTLPVVDLPDNWQFTGWLYNGQLLAPGTYDVNALIPATYENVNDIQYFVAQFKEVQTWTVSVKVGSSSSKEITYSTTVEAEKDKTPVLDHAMYDRIFAAAGKEFVVSDYVSVPSRWSSVNSSNHTAYVRLVPKDESSHKLAVHFYVEDNGCIKGAFNRITSYSYTDLKTDSTGSIRIPEVQADDGYEFKGWANERGEIVFAPGTSSVLISQIPHTYLQDEASAHFYAVIEELGKQTKTVTFGFTKDIAVTPTVEVAVELDKDVMEVDPNTLPAIKAVLDENGWIAAESSLTVAGEYVTVIYSEAELNVTLNLDTNMGTVPGLVSSNVCKPGESVELPNVTANDGYTFLGWADGNGKLWPAGNVSASELFDFTASPAGGAVTLTASFDYNAELDVTLSLDNTKGTVLGLVSNVTCQPDESLELPNVTANDGYIFKGWTDGNGKRWPAGNVSASELFDFTTNPAGGAITLTASFDYDAKLTVNLVVNSEQGETSGLVTEFVVKPGDAFELPNITPKAGYTFEGWLTEKDNEFDAGIYYANAIFDFAANPTGGTKTYTAKFSEDTGNTVSGPSVTLNLVDFLNQPKDSITYAVEQSVLDSGLLEITADVIAAIEAKGYTLLGVTQDDQYEITNGVVNITVN